MQLENIPFSEIKVGDVASLERPVKIEDLELFAEATGDYNPIHLDESFAKQTDYGKCIAHGMWVGSLISALLATKLPGPGGVYLSQSLKFHRPAFVGDILTVKVTVLAKKRRNILIMECEVTNQHQKMVVKGECMVTTQDQR
ncbi:MAG: MaoC family dehydratase [Verrucomicrobiota bacterium]